MALNRAHRSTGPLWLPRPWPSYSAEQAGSAQSNLCLGRRKRRQRRQLNVLCMALGAYVGVFAPSKYEGALSNARRIILTPHDAGILGLEGGRNQRGGAPGSP